MPVSKIYKVLVAGPPQWGKTSLLEAVISGSPGKPIPTIEDTYVATVDTEQHTRERLRFYDTAGSDGIRLDTIKHFFAVMDGFLLVYDVNDIESYRAMERLKREVERAKEKVPIIILGNKIDVPASGNARVEVTHLASKLQKDRVKLYETSTSASHRQVLHEAFVYLASKMSAPPAPRKAILPGLVPGLGTRGRNTTTSVATAQPSAADDK